MNNVNLIGRVGADPELRYTPTGTAVTEVNLAVDDGFGANKKTAWIGVTIWGATAETCAKYVAKGDRLGISGRLSQDEWKDKETGKQQRKTKVTCEQMTLLGEKRDRPAQSAPASQPRQSNPPPAVEDFSGDDDIPF